MYYPCKCCTHATAISFTHASAVVNPQKFAQKLIFEVLNFLLVIKTEDCFNSINYFIGFMFRRFLF